MHRPQLAFSILLLLLHSVQAQQLEKNIEKSRENGLKMLKVVKEQIEKHYYDPTFHAVDLDARFGYAEARINQATSAPEVIGIIAQAVLDLNDSHTILVPPLKGFVVVYGWRMQMIGDRCYVISVLKGSDAESKGLKPGDRILALDGFEPTRALMWKMKYYYYELRPKSQVKVRFQTIEGATRDVDIVTKLEKLRYEEVSGYIYSTSEIGPELGAEKTMDVSYEELGDLMISRLSSFELEDSAVDKMMKRISPYKTLILDLRGNPGGHTATLARYLGYFFDHEVKIADFKMRKETKEIRVKPRRSNNFTGNLIVLIDSESTSASEVFARVIQLEKRGTVIGDRSGGLVMQAARFDYEFESLGNPVLYGLEITNANLIMSDGKSLEWVGVTPDRVILPTANDIKSHRDPALSYAASLAGVDLDPSKAGALFEAKESKQKH
ncbi:MAG TPA: S41 family peptidase [Pyrinomonadaceae bacterium]|nr:S41 family peptidase [Pyrinomonadaceae bacterium]